MNTDKTIQRIVFNMAMLIILSVLNVWIGHDFMQSLIGSDNALIQIWVFQLVLVWIYRHTITVSLIWAFLITIGLCKILLSIVLLPFYLIGRAFQQGKDSVK